MLYYVRVSGNHSFISSVSNLYYLCDNCLKWFRSDLIISVYTYPDTVLVATIHSGKITFHRLGGCP